MRRNGISIICVVLGYVIVISGNSLFAAEEAVNNVSSFTPIIGKISSILLDILQPVIVLIGSFAFWKLAKKFGFEKTQIMDDRVQKIVENGVLWAEAWANKQSKKPKADDKMSQAVIFITEAFNNEKIKGIAQEKIKQLVEAKLIKYN